MRLPAVTMTALASMTVLLAACADDSDGADPDPGATTTSSTDTDSADPSSGGGSGSAPSPADTASASGSPSGDDGPDNIEVEDQTGNGSTVVVARVTAAADGFLLITAADDPGTEFGSAPVEAGTSGPVDIPTTITASGEYDALLYADDGDGSFDPALDQPVVEADHGDPVAEDFDYRIG